MNRKLFLISILFLSALTGCNKVENFTATAPNKNIILNLHNKERLKKHYDLFQIDETLNIAAQKYAEKMVQTGVFEHGDVAERLGPDWMMYGENIAYGQSSNEEVMLDWMNSRGHRMNILNKNFKYIGIGIAKNKNGTIYWVVDFGTK